MEEMLRKKDVVEWLEKRVRFHEKLVEIAERRDGRTLFIESEKLRECKDNLAYVKAMKPVVFKPRSSEEPEKPKYQSVPNYQRQQHNRPNQNESMEEEKK